jgi:C_GCAxxG_C_C family probable redox protein
MAVCQKLGVESPLIPRIATAFAGGMGRSGEVCGAVVGGTMCIGIRHGREEPGQWQQDDLANSLTQRFVRAFREEMGTIYCRELTGFDLSTAEGLKAFRASDAPVRICLRAVGFAYDKTLALLEA